jgi:hypothetical protein
MKVQNQQFALHRAAPSFVRNKPISAESSKIRNAVATELDRDVLAFAKANVMLRLAQPEDPEASPLDRYTRLVDLDTLESDPRASQPEKQVVELAKAIKASDMREFFDRLQKLKRLIR